jgi:diguanylate cyclase (GGDEF)-like protein/PAS domain S-box-containing protein
VIEDEDGSRRLAGVMTDVTREHEALDAEPDAPPGLTRSAAASIHRTLLDNLSDGIYSVDADRRIRYWNRGAERLTGYAAAAVIGRRCHDDVLCHVDADGHSLCGACPVSLSLARGWGRQQVTWLRHADGHRVPVLARSNPIRVPGSSVVRGAVEMFTDMTGLLDHDGPTRGGHDPFADPVTGIPDRRLLEVVLRARKDDLDRYRLPFGLLVLEVDGFAELVIEHGPVQGDLALRVVANTIKGAIRAGDTLVRWGPTGFAVAIAMADADGLATVAERIRHLVRSAELRGTGGRRLAVGVAVGAVLARQAEPVDVLCARAERAAAAASSGGHDRIVLDGGRSRARAGRVLGATRHHAS